MKVNLKKAAALAAAVSAVQVETVYKRDVDLYADVPTPETLEEVRNNFINQVVSGLNLIETAFTIRSLIGQANQAKVNSLLAQLASVEKQLSFLNKIPLKQKATDLVALSRQIEATREKGERPAYPAKPLVFEVETESVVVPVLSQLRRRKRVIEEELQSLNFTTVIELPEEVVGVLTRLDLI